MNTVSAESAASRGDASTTRWPLSRSDQARCGDILAVIEHCRSYAPSLRSDEDAAMAQDAILRNLAVIG